MNEIHMDAIVVELIASFLSMLLIIIAFFLSRLLKQFDGLTTQVKELNTTMGKIDKDLSGEVGILKGKVDDLDEVWGRIRTIEGSVISLQSGGCNLHNRCHPSQ